jgi:hypothetical protein
MRKRRKLYEPAVQDRSELLLPRHSMTRAKLCASTFVPVAGTARSAALRRTGGATRARCKPEPTTCAGLASRTSRAADRSAALPRSLTFYNPAIVSAGRSAASRSNILSFPVSPRFARGYVAIGTWLVPRLWSDPLGPRVKIWPIIVIRPHGARNL